MHYLTNVIIDFYETNVYDLELDDQQELSSFLEAFFEESDFYGFVCFYTFYRGGEIVEDVYPESSIPQFIQRIAKHGLEINAAITTKYHGVDIILQFDFYRRLGSYVMSVLVDENVEEDTKFDIFELIEEL